jgi:hypothetical protein
MERLTGENLRAMKFMCSRTVAVAGIEGKLLRQGMTAELSFELQAPAEHGRVIWDTIVAAGQEFGIPQMAALRAEFAVPRRGITTLAWNTEDGIDFYASLFRDGGDLLISWKCHKIHVRSSTRISREARGSHCV